MANLGVADTLFLMVLALVVFGPHKLPQLARQLGKLMYEFRKASNDFKFQMEEELRQSEEADRRKKEEAERQRALTALPVPEQAATPAQETPAAADPYPSQPAYPESSLGTAEAERSEEPAAEEAPLRVEPPSTGETVTAASPHKPADNAPAEAERPEPEASHG